MRPLGRSARGVIFAGIVAWHALVVLLLLRQRVVLSEPPEFVMTWLRFETPLRAERIPVPLPAPLLSPALTPPPSPDVPTTTSTSEASTAITQPSDVDWYREASRAAREQYQGRLPTPRSLDDAPKTMEMPSPERREHRRGDQEPMGNGEWRLWVSSRCWTVISSPAPLPPGQVRPMSVQCVPKPPAIDAAVLERRKPNYILEPALTLPRKGKGAGQPRPGPSMGGTPIP